MATVSRPRAFNPAEMQRRVRHPLQSIRGTIRRYVLMEGFLLAALYLAVAFWLGMALDFGLFYLFRFDWLLELQEATGNTADLWFRAIVLGLFGIGLAALVTYKVLLRLFREFSDISVALLLEKRFPRQLGDRLITAVELADPRMAEKYGFSGDMVQKTIEDAADRVEQVPVNDVFNWGRLKGLGWLALAATVGVYYVMMIVGMIVIAASAEADEEGRAFAGGPRASSPVAWFGRFNGAVGNWFQREVLLQDEYWPRDAYVELVRFQDTPRRPGDMRVGRDEIRPDLHVKAFRWVHVDERPAREEQSVVEGKSGARRVKLVRNHYGWRPLYWVDLEGLVDASLLAAANEIPSDWHGWGIEIDDLDRAVPKNLAPVEWIGKSIGEVLDQKRKGEAAALARFAALDQDEYREAAERLFDWKRWTLDRIELQLQKQRRVDLLAQEHAKPYEALRAILAALEERIDEQDNRGRVRLLEVPDHVYFYYRGEKTANPPDNAHEQMRDQDGLYQRKYRLPLGDLEESVSFHVTAADYSTAKRSVTLVPPTSVKKLTLQVEEPAYVHHRIKGDSFLLKGKKQTMAGQTASVTGDTSTIQVKYGSDLKFIAETDRPLKGRVLMSVPQKLEERAAQLPPSPPLVAQGGKSFSMTFPNVRQPYEFVLEFNDEDNVKGRRRILIRPKEDREPEIFDVEMKVVLRKPRVKKDNKEGGSILIDLPINALLITPDAELPFRASLKDDYGLTAAYWKYEVQPVKFELMGHAGEMPKAPVVLGGPASERRALLLGTAWQFMPGHAAPIAAPPYLAAMQELLDFDLKNGPEEGRIDFPSFAARMEELTLRDPVLAGLLEKLGRPTSSTEMVRDHELTDLDHFYVPHYLPKLKSDDPQKEGQLHYQLKLHMETVDSNVETGPGLGKNRQPFTFLVVSENELLSQIALEEESLRDSLDGAVEKIQDAETILREMKRRFEGGDPVSFEALIQRSEDANSLISKAASSIREAGNAYARIALEMHYNNIRRDRQAQLLDNILDPLQSLLKAGGEVPEIEKAFDKLIARLEVDKKQELPHGPEHAALTGEVVTEIEKLAEKLNRILLHMEADITWARSLEQLISIERTQREVAQRIREEYLREQEALLKLLGDLQ